MKGKWIFHQLTDADDDDDDGLYIRLSIRLFQMHMWWVNKRNT